MVREFRTTLPAALPASAGGSSVSRDVSINAPINITGYDNPADLSRHIRYELDSLLRTARDAVPQ